MRHWNFRVLAFREAELDYFKICEVHYEDDVPISWSDHTPEYTDVKNMGWHFMKMREATEKPVLWGGDRFPEEYNPHEDEVEDDKCHICNKPTEPAGGDPTLWPIAIEYPGGQGKERTYHRGCLAQLVDSALTFLNQAHGN